MLEEYFTKFFCRYTTYTLYTTCFFCRYTIFLESIRWSYKITLMKIKCTLSLLRENSRSSWRKSGKCELKAIKIIPKKIKKWYFFQNTPMFQNRLIWSRKFGLRKIFFADTLRYLPRIDLYGHISLDS